MIKSEKKWWMRKAYAPLQEKYDEVIRERIKRGKDRQPSKYARLDRAIFRYNKLWEDLINADFINEK